MIAKSGYQRLEQQSGGNSWRVHTGPASTQLGGGQKRLAGLTITAKRGAWWWVPTPHSPSPPEEEEKNSSSSSSSSSSCSSSSSRHDRTALDRPRLL